MELRVVGYQFPDLEAGTELRDPDSWDSNWLMIDGSVPPATTSQKAEAAVRNRYVPDDQLIAAGWQTFLEPNLSFAVGRQVGEQVELLIAFSQEAVVAPIDVDRLTRSQVAIATTTQYVHDVAGALHEQLLTYPAR